MKTNRIVWGPLALLLSAAVFGWWRSGQLCSQPSAQSARNANATSIQRIAGRQVGAFTFYQHPEEAPGWAIPYGKEFWRRPASGALRHGKSDRIQPGAAPALDEVIDRVSHAFAVAECT